MAKEEKKNEEEKAAERPSNERALMLELEHVLVNSRAAMFAVLKESIAAYDKELTVPLFSRFCLYSIPEDFVPALCEELEISTRSSGKIVKEVKNGIEAYWKSSDKKLRPGVADFLGKTKNRGFAQIAITALPENDAAQVLQALGESCESLEIQSFAEEEKVVAGADTWMQAAIDREMSSGNCIGLASSSIACRAALSADLHCIALTDDFTEFEDFGGSHLAIASLDEVDADELMETFYQNSED